MTDGTRGHRVKPRTKERPAPFQITTVGEQIARARSGAVTRWLAESVLVKGGSTLLYAPAGHGKSLVAMDLALAASEGRPWLGVHDLGDPIPTLYLDDDGNNDHEFNGRLLSFGADSDNPHLHCMLHQGFLLTDVVQRAELLRWCEAQDIQLLVIDSLTRVHRMAESSAQGMRLVSAAIKQFCLRGITVVVLHHATKGGQTFRGSGEIAAAFDGVLRLQKEDDETFVMTPEKARSVSRGGQWRGCRIAVAEDEDGHLVLDGSQPLGGGAVVKTAQENLRTRIVELLRGGPKNVTTLRKTELKLPGRDYPLFDAAVAWLLAEGLITSRRQGKATVYELAEDSADGEDSLDGGGQE